VDLCGCVGSRQWCGTFGALVGLEMEDASKGQMGRRASHGETAYVGQSALKLKGLVQLESEIEWFFIAMRQQIRFDVDSKMRGDDAW